MIVPADHRSPPAPPKGKTRIWSHLQLSLYLLAISGLLTGAIGVLLFLFIALDIPDLHSLASYQPPTTSVIYDRKGGTIARFFSEDRMLIALNQMPELLPKAFIAAEDARFFQHGGVDLWSIFRALLHNLKAGAKGQGGSTITQQVTRSLLLSPEKTYTRKIKEAILAYRIDRLLTKEEILHIYLNQIYLGEGSYGVEAAARTYFDKHAAELDLAEIAILAGLPQAPSRYSPFKHFQQAKRRQAYVLNRMAEDGYISAPAARKAYEQPLAWAGNTPTFDPGRYFVQQVSNYLAGKYGSELLNRGGLRIHTTMDRAMQEAATNAVQSGIARWAIRQKSRTEQTPQAALIAMEIESGRILALVGGSSYDRSQFNRATQAKRQPGSAFKPIVYAAAFAQGLTPETIIEDAPLSLGGSAAIPLWQPQNFDGKFNGPTTLRQALIHSNNIVTIKLLQQTGIPNTIKLAQQLGIQSPLAKNLSLALGAAELSLSELTSAYTVFASGGSYHPPFFIDRILDRHGNLLEEHKPTATTVLSKEVCYQITSLLQGVISEGTGKNARGLELQAAGKTGTTDQNMDAWFIGYTPTLAAGVWMGYDQHLSLGSRETGGQATAPIWLTFMKNVVGQLPNTAFTIPEGMNPPPPPTSPTSNDNKEIETESTLWIPFH